MGETNEQHALLIPDIFAEDVINGRGDEGILKREATKGLGC